MTESAPEKIIDPIVEKGPQEFDLGIAWNWQLDKEFIEEIIDECQKNNITYYIIDALNLKETIEKINTQALKFRFFFDRASDLNEEFKKLTQAVKAGNIRIIADPLHAERVTDKAIMHFVLLSSGVNVPFTILVSSFQHSPRLDEEIKRLGSPFIIKLSNEGGGEGVILDAQTLEDLLRVRQRYGEKVYLLQERIDPILLNGHRAWFRVYYVFGKIIICWWDNITKISDLLTPNGMHFLGLEPLRHITQKIAKLCQLEFFSTEIALTNKKRFVVVDYVNDQCDMRKKTMYYDGVPDEVVKAIVRQLVSAIKKILKK